MNTWLGKRIGQSVFTIWAVTTITFGLTRFLPGGPVEFIKARLLRQNQNVNEERINRLVEVYTNVNPDTPPVEAYFDYIFQLVQGNLGRSLYYQEPVSNVLAEALPWTVFLMSIAVTLMFAIGILLGALMAYFEGGPFDSITSSGSTIAMSIPYYLIAVIFLYLFGYIAGVFPTGGRYSSGLEPAISIKFAADALYHAVLPVVSIVIPGFGGPALQMRGNSISVLGENYLRVARLRGLSGTTIATRYVGRNAILPMYTNFLIYLGIYFGGSVIIEEIFTYPGVGFYMFRAINTRDYPLMMGSFLVLTVAVVVAIFIADLTYGKIDPRARVSGERESY